LAGERGQEEQPGGSQVASPVVKLETAESLRDLAPMSQVKLSLSEVRLLLKALLPTPVFDREAALVNYRQRHKALAYRSHRRRRLKRLDELRPQVSL
jgi:hypothetical protein